MRIKSLRQLNFHHLHYFWVVAREGHLTRAAQQLHVSQSALSSQIRELESQLGHALFLREGRALRLTEFGVLALGYADGIFSLGSELVATAQSGTGLQAQHLRVGAVATLSRNFQDNFLRPVLGMPGIRLTHESASLEELLERLRAHRLDLILSNRPVTTDAQQRWRCRRVSRQSVCLVGPPRRGRKAFRFPEDLNDALLLLPGRSSDIRIQFDLLCEELGISVRPYAEVDDMAMLRLMARDSGGVTLVPEVVVQDELKTRLLQKYCEVPRVFENFYAITMRRHFQSAVMTALLVGD
jgi:LysR family transcriptional activator of nhaA